MGNAWRLGGSDRFDQAALEEVCYLDAVNFLVWLREPTPPPPNAQSERSRRRCRARILVVQ